MRKQEGILSVVAKTAGIKLIVDGVESSWINPTKSTKEMLLKDLEELKSIKGKAVTIYLNENNEYTIIRKSDSEPIPMEDGESPAELIEELIQDDEKSNIDNLIQPQPKEVEQLVVKHNNYFTKLAKVKCETKTLGYANLIYISWAEAWTKLKEIYPDSNFHVHENNEGMPYFADSTGGFVKVSVTVKDITHTVHLPIMDNKNKSIQKNEINTFEINKSIQRALTKCIGFHGCGLYVYNGSDFPELK